MKSYKVTIAVFLVSAFLLGWGSARADVPTGAFTGEVGGRTVLAFVKTATVNHSRETFAVLLIDDGNSSLFGAGSRIPGMLFKVEDRGDGTAAWLPIDQSPRGLLRTFQYRVAFSMSFSNSQKFQLAKQPDVPSFEIPNVQIALERTSLWEWKDGPQEEVLVNGGCDEDIRFCPKDRIIVGACLNQDNLVVHFENKTQEIFPGLWTVRKSIPNSTAMKGKVLEPHLLGVSVWIYYTGSGLFANSEHQLRFLRMGVHSKFPNNTQCFVTCS